MLLRQETEKRRVNGRFRGLSIVRSIVLYSDSAGLSWALATRTLGIPPSRWAQTTAEGPPSCRGGVDQWHNTNELSQDPQHVGDVVNHVLYERAREPKSTMSRGHSPRNRYYSFPVLSPP